MKLQFTRHGIDDDAFEVVTKEGLVEELMQMLRSGGTVYTDAADFWIDDVDDRET